jgi:hypothetical protein
MPAGWADCFVGSVVAHRSPVAVPVTAEEDYGWASQEQARDERPLALRESRARRERVGPPKSKLVLRRLRHMQSVAIKAI